MHESKYIQVILPLKLDWLPWYRTDDPDIRTGSRVRVLFSGRSYQAVVKNVADHPEIDISKVRSIECVEKYLDTVSVEELRLWDFVSDYYLCTLGEVFKMAYPSGRIAREEASARLQARKEFMAEKTAALYESRLERLRSRLEKKEASLQGRHNETVTARLKEGMAAIESEIVSINEALSALRSAPAGGAAPSIAISGNAVSLTAAQEAAAASIRSAFRKSGTVLLHGVTGSGKTEVYMEMALEQMSAGRSVLLLVPEIALSRQLEERMAAVFGQSLLVFHSAETASRRREVTSRMKNGTPYIVLGTRSALFLPHKDLGLVIVDEEHDTSYKQDSVPRYNGRDIAVVLALVHGAKALLGSATPSLETIYNCRSGLYGKVDLTERFYATQPADVCIIDTVAERRKNGMIGSFSRKLIDLVNRTLAAGEQVVILRSRRAYAPVVQCEACGWIPKCPHCNVPLPLHRRASGDVLMCRYCGRTQAYSSLCPQCGSAMKLIGAGTQKVEEEAAALFPSARIARLDGDSVRESEYQKQILSDFSEGKTDILVGTQMVAKGFDFSGLTLVAVLHAETLSSIQDFRADEHTMQLLEQFRGRCARRGGKGIFVIQTSQAEHPVYSMSSGVDADRLLSERKDFSYPPFTRLVDIVIKDKDEARLDEMSRKLAQNLSERISGNGAVTLLGPYAPQPDRIAGTVIRNIRLTFPRDRMLPVRKNSLKEAVSAFERETKYAGHIQMDVDPV